MNLKFIRNIFYVDIDDNFIEIAPFQNNNNKKIDLCSKYNFPNDLKLQSMSGSMGLAFGFFKCLSTLEVRY